MYKKTHQIIAFAVVILLYFVPVGSAFAQELGANFNHNPEIIDFKYLKKSKVEWVRATPRILDYVNGELKIDTDEGIRKIIEAGERGYKVAFGFRWDFNMHDMHIPEPGSPEEKKLFEYERRILELVGPHVDMFKLGNEPNLETKMSDMLPNDDGVIPLLRFMERQLELVVEPYFNAHPERAFPPVYLGSLPRLFMEETQQIPAVKGMIEMANDNDKIAGLAVHLHISSVKEIDESFEFVRSIMPTKPIIVPEFSFHRLYLEKISDPLGSTPAGKAFAAKYHRDPAMKLYEWCGIANTKGVSQEEWEDLFYSRSWFPKHYLREYYERYKKYGVVLATFPLLQQSCPENMTPKSPMWFINPIFAQKSLLKQTNGDYSSNPLVFDDFVDWASGNWK